MEQVLEELKNLKKTVEKIQEERMDEDPVSQQAATEDVDTVDWAELLVQELKQPSTPEACELCLVLGSPPPLDRMRHIAKQQTKYSGIPATPSKRSQHRLDCVGCGGQNRQMKSDSLIGCPPRTFEH